MVIRATAEEAKAGAVSPLHAESSSEHTIATREATSAGCIRGVEELRSVASKVTRDKYDMTRG